MDATNAVNHTDPDLFLVQADAGIVAARSYDEAYRFGRRPNSRAPFPFTEREFARLLIARGRIHTERSTFGLADA
jgi:hypothetical protein